jgi:hypothetical protein
LILHVGMACGSRVAYGPAIQKKSKSGKGLGYRPGSGDVNARAVLVRLNLLCIHQREIYSAEVRDSLGKSEAQRRAEVTRDS